MKNESLPDAVGAAPFTLQSLSLAFKHPPACSTAAHRQPRPSKSETLDIMILGNRCQAKRRVMESATFKYIATW